MLYMKYPVGDKKQKKIVKYPDPNCLYLTSVKTARLKVIASQP